MDSESIPKKEINFSTKPVDVRVFVIIGFLVILYQIGLFLIKDYEGYDITETGYIVGIGLVAIFAFIAAKEQSNIKLFRNANIVLGIGFIGLLIGDLAFIYYEYVLEVDPYPSPFDIGFLVTNAGMIFFVVQIFRFSKLKIDIKRKSILVLIPIIVTLAYSVTAFLEWGEYDEVSFDVLWGSIFTAGSALSLTFAVLGMSIFKHSSLREVWLIIMAGFFLYSLSDLWYYYLEAFEAYYSTHVVNTMWIASFLLIIYGLILHRKKNQNKI